MVLVSSKAMNSWNYLIGVYFQGTQIQETL